MNAIDVIDNIISNPHLFNLDLKYCLVDENKVPYRYDEKNAKPNDVNDFVDLNKILTCKHLRKYKGLGLSIQANNIYAIDVDHCISDPFNIETIDERGQDIIDRFKNDAYIEFSFSGTGLRILFKSDIIEDYKNKYYIKNSKYNIEYYQPSDSFRYVTITGKSVFTNEIKKIDEKLLIDFLETYMKREKVEKVIAVINDDKTINELKEIVRYHLFKNSYFQDLWFGKAPGYGKNENELDFAFISYLYENITQNKEKIITLFEDSDYYKSKDYMHKNKWTKNDHFYLNSILKKIGE